MIRYFYRSNKTGNRQRRYFRNKMQILHIMVKLLQLLCASDNYLFLCVDDLMSIICSERLKYNTGDSLKTWIDTTSRYITYMLPLFANKILVLVV